MPTRSGASVTAPAAESAMSRSRARVRRRGPSTMPLSPLRTRSGSKVISTEHLAHTARGVGREQQPVAAPPPEDVPDAAGQHAQLAGGRRRLPAMLDVAAQAAPARVRGAHQRPQAGVAGVAPMHQPGARHVHHLAAARAHAALPHVLVEAVRDARVEHAGQLERAPVGTHVRAPHDVDLTVLRARVERRDRRRLAAAHREARALQPQLDRPAEHLCVGMALAPVEQLAQPVRRRFDVVVDEHHEGSGACLDPGVAGRVEARHAGPLDIPHTGRGRGRAGVRRWARRQPRSPRRRRGRGPARRESRAPRADNPRAPWSARSPMLRAGALGEQ